MGSLPEGTLCSYCGVREAGYIPDGAAGPICFEPDGKCCWDRVVALGWDVIVQERQMRLNTKSEYHYSSAIYKVRPPLGARDSLSDLFGWPTFDYQSLHWKRVMPCVYGWNFSGLQGS